MEQSEIQSLDFTNREDSTVISREFQRMRDSLDSPLFPDFARVLFVKKQALTMTFKKLFSNPKVTSFNLKRSALPDHLGSEKEKNTLPSYSPAKTRIIQPSRRCALLQSCRLPETGASGNASEGLNGFTPYFF